jgi:hypothetical protein
VRIAGASFWPAQGPIIALVVEKMQENMLWWKVLALIVRAGRYISTALPAPESMIIACGR